MCNHHLDEATIVSFASGAISSPLAVVVSSHLEMCSHCRDQVQKAEVIGGSLLDDTQEQPLSDRSLNDLLEKLGARNKNRLSEVAEQSTPIQCEVLPSCVSNIVKKPVAEVSWKRVGAGVSLFQIATENTDKASSEKLFLMKIEAGRTMPEHGHGGSETTLILSGSYSDELGTFERGDVADLDEDIEHQPIVSKEAPCICLVAIEAPTRFKGFFPKLLQPYVGL